MTRVNLLRSVPGGSASGSARFGESPTRRGGVRAVARTHVMRTLALGPRHQRGVEPPHARPRRRATRARHPAHTVDRGRRRASRRERVAEAGRATRGTPRLTAGTGAPARCDQPCAAGGLLVDRHHRRSGGRGPHRGTRTRVGVGVRVRRAAQGSSLFSGGVEVLESHTSRDTDEELIAFSLRGFRRPRGAAAAAPASPQRTDTGARVRERSRHQS